MTPKSTWLALATLAGFAASNPLPFTNTEPMFIGTLGEGNLITIHTGFSEPANKTSPATASTALGKRDSFTCPHMGRNPSGDDCSEIYNSIRNVPRHIWAIPPMGYYEFNYASCRLRVQNRDTCVTIHAHGSGIAPKVNSMLQCPYYYEASALITMDSPPVMLIMTGQSDDLPAYSADDNCSIPEYTF
ncbi:hypothetical protein NQ176_g4930 [Zarea fungicola]|uniref:Uncharacterized protein n=1 Tax=Zarea fungicola TaxID=93591 RepID=A0ACC1NC71_9HYPO|nr:hypothetical protein NQ176_g4930 [Lecanicillium fungicola]